jgi:hypothetical protein
VEEAQVLPGALVDEVSRPSLLLARARIVPAGRKSSTHPVLGKAKADPSSDACAILEILCVNEFMDSQIRTRESDALEAYRARTQGKELELKAARLEKQNQLVEARTAKLRLENQALEDKIALVREKALEAHNAKKEGKPFNYERALNQISAVIGLRGPEMFRHEKRPQELS